MAKELNIEQIVELYQKGNSLNSIARLFDTYPTTISRALKQSDIELRHDTVRKGSYMINNGEKLIAWAKSQGRLVSKAELAAVIGRKRLSNSYFTKYPELSRYVKPTAQTELQEYVQHLYTWLNENNIPYKPNDKVVLEGTPVHAALLDDYEGIVLHVNIKPQCVSMKSYNRVLHHKLAKANEKKIVILFLTKDHFDKLDELKDLLDGMKIYKIKE